MPATIVVGESLRLRDTSKMQMAPASGPSATCQNGAISAFARFC